MASQPPEISSVGVTSSPPAGIFDSVIGSSVNPHTRAGDILGRTAAAAGTQSVDELTPPGTAKGILGFESMLEKTDLSKVIEEHSSRLITSSSRMTKLSGVIMREKCRPQVFPSFLSALNSGGRPRFGVVKVAGSDRRLKIIKFEFGSDETPAVEMKPDHQEEDISDDVNNKEEITTGDHHHHHHEKNQTKLCYGMCMESLGSESFSEKMDLMCKIINESSRLISGAMKTCGVTRDNMSSNPKGAFPPTLYTVDSRRSPIPSSKKAVGRDGVSNAEMIGYRQDDCGNDASDNGDDRQEEVGNNNGESNEKEMLGDHQDDDDNQTDEMTGDHWKNSKKKNKNNYKKKKKKKKNKNNRKKT
ncbi:hypothetical protein WN944_016944 [Citrus x changshan-huyou]|uniref:Uncharacterized protein n=1 Tax=Citrus x changshan-huyou TaxID=2935761 RepID=A0AAP0QKU0_9ROSI